MELEPECVHEVPRNTCAWCGPRKGDWAIRRMAGENPEPDKHELDEKAELGRRIIADFPGNCRTCGLPFHEGESIVWFPGNGAVGPCCQLAVDEDGSWEA